MPSASPKAEPRDARVLDFKKAYAEIHGKEPEVPAQPPSVRPDSAQKGMFRKSQVMEQVDALMAPTGKKGKRLVAELDLEAREGKRGIFKSIIPGDTVKIHAGRSLAEIVFTGLNDEGKLLCMRFKMDEVPYPFEIDFSANEGPTKVWDGTLMDGSYFKVQIAMLPIYSFSNGVIANVDISVIIERNPLTNQFDF